MAHWSVPWISTGGGCRHWRCPSRMPRPLPTPSKEVAVAYSAGTAYLEIVPSFRDVESLLARGARDIAKGLDKALGDQLTQAVRKGTQNAERETARAGAVLGKTFADGAIRRIQSA